MNSKKQVGVFVGRLCPIHIGHQSTINKMIEECGIENSIVILGSVGQKVTFRVLFSYHLRKKWIQTIYGKKLRVVGIPDFPNDNVSWMELLIDNVDSAFYHLDEYDVVFYGGGTTDLDEFHNRGYKTRINDRTVMPVSATLIRDLLLHGNSIADFIDYEIHDDVVRQFARVMEESEKWETPF